EEIEEVERAAGVAVGAGVSCGELVLEAEEVEEIEAATAIAVGVAAAAFVDDAQRRARAGGGLAGGEPLGGERRSLVGGLQQPAVIRGGVVHPCLEIGHHAGALPDEHAGE